ncbi:bet1-like SNARE 1-1 [Pyrus ussuriensis x Pyrus communis]|uniref:Bet1-like SNARE 1-1 n=1 Tax=Pyrus ussuriensis x Pyrus communis TaxID=2448454 RepID=A0A5N5H9L2_9ROSA|nr:bet1-like SNARE 1-1 [Pyrus ussuriensis x Pyrus communis]
MSNRREHRSSKASLLDGLEEGGLRASSSYSHDFNEHDNDKAVQSLQDRVVFLKRLTGDIHEEVESHNRLLDRMVCFYLLNVLCLAIAWMCQGVYCLEQWIDLKWYLRKNQAGERVYLWHILWFSS